MKIIRKNKFIGLIFVALFFFSCKSSLYSEICDCGLSFKEKDLIPITGDQQEGFHGDGYIIAAYRYKYLNSEDIIKLQKKGFVGRNNLYIPTISELNSILTYDSTQLCFVRKRDDKNAKVVKACIVDTIKKIIIAYQISQ